MQKTVKSHPHSVKIIILEKLNDFNGLWGQIAFKIDNIKRGCFTGIYINL